MHLVSACAKQNLASKTEYHKVWRALLSCTEEILASGRGVIIEKLGTVTYVSRSVREGAWAGHKGCVFVANPKFARTFSVLQRKPPQRSLLAPAVPISSARIGHTAGVDHDYTRAALAAIVDSIGRRICSGAKLCLAFGRVGSLVAKERVLTFVFADGFRRPKTNPTSMQDKYRSDVRRILAALEAKAKGDPGACSPGVERTNATRPETSPAAAPAAVAGGRVATGGGRASSLERKARKCSRSSKNGRGIGSEPISLSVRSSVLTGRSRSIGGSGRQGRPGSALMVAAVVASDVRRGTASRSQRWDAPACRNAVFEEPGRPTARPMITGPAAMVAGGPRAQHEAASAATVHHEAIGGNDCDVSPRTAKKVLPHFLAIGNAGSQALVPTEGAQIVQRQARDRFAKTKAANILLDEKEFNETKRRQHAKWVEYEESITEERKRLRDYFEAVKRQAESQKAARDEKISLEFMKGNSDPGRAYPCRMEYDIDKEQAWRKAWCADLEKQVELKQRVARGIRNAEASKDRLRAAQLDAAIKADRRREMKVMHLDRETIKKDWETQVSSFAHPEGGGRRKDVILDKIVR